MYTCHHWQCRPLSRAFLRTLSNFDMTLLCSSRLSEGNFWVKSQTSPHFLHKRNIFRFTCHGRFALSPQCAQRLRKNFRILSLHLKPTSEGRFAPSVPGGLSVMFEKCVCVCNEYHVLLKLDFASAFFCTLTLQWYALHACICLGIGIFLNTLPFSSTIKVSPAFLKRL